MVNGTPMDGRHAWLGSGRACPAQARNVQGAGPMRTIISGSRTFADYDTLCRVMSATSFPVTEVVSGGAPGVDALAERWAQERGVPVKRFPAEWEKYGRAARPKRNELMAGYAEALVAVCDGGSRTRSSLIAGARKRGLCVFVRRLV